MNRIAKNKAALHGKSTRDPLSSDDKLCIDVFCSRGLLVESATTQELQQHCPCENLAVFSTLVHTLREQTTKMIVITSILCKGKWKKHG